MNQRKMDQGKIGQAAANLFPGYFALVMATGIVFIAAYILEMKSVAWALLVVNLAAYVILWLLLLIRLVRFFPRVKADVTDHVRGPGFFTVVAGTCVLGSQLVIVAGQHGVATILWSVGLLLWAVVMYTFFTAVTVRENKPPLETGISGAHQPLRVKGKLIARPLHAVIGVRGSFLSTDSLESAAEERTCRAGVTNLHAAAYTRRL